MQNDNKTKPVLVEQLAMSLAYQMEAIIRLLEQKGVLTRVEIVQEIEKIQEAQKKSNN
jgi:hypothetical protein